ncbi:hypothetical protein B0T09DRAFT_394782 [Sordaria sp. MPI-SDFR-AT-0083]|nr:hypothetical protein B0T09DRAFT_394782 [Sordaria sp. MPI-SDFR-AT-0083]
MENPPITAGDSPPPSPPSQPQPQESILNRKILPRGLPHSFSSNLNRDVITPSKKPKANNNRSVRSIIASFESAASKQPPPYSPVFESITPRCSTIRSSASTGASLTSFRRVKGNQGRDRGVSECHDARRSQYRENDREAWEAGDAGAGVEGTRSVSTPVIPRMSSIMPFAMDEEDSLTLLNYKSYFNQPLARCLDGFVDFNEGEEEVDQQNEKHEDKKLRDKPDDFDKENKPLRITKRQDRVKTAQTETHITTSAPRLVQRQSRRPSLMHRKSSASVVALEKLMHELENFSINPPLEEEESEIIAMEEDKPIIRRDPTDVQDFWWTVRRNLWVDEDEVYNPDDHRETKISTLSSDIPKIQLPLPGTTDVSTRASCAFAKQIPLPAPPIPFRSPNRLSSVGRGSPSPMGTPTRLPNRSISSKSNSPLKHSVLTAGHPPPSPSASVRPEPPTPLSPPRVFRQSPSPPPRSSKRPVSPPLSTAGKDEYLDGNTPKASPSKKSTLSLMNQEHPGSRGPSSSSLDVNASTSQADWDSALGYEDEEVHEQKAEDTHQRRTQPDGPSLDEIDGLFSRVPADSAASSPATAVAVDGSQENTPRAESAFDQIKKKIESREEKKRSVHSRHSSLVRLSDTSESKSLPSQSGSYQETEQEQQHSPHSPEDHPSPTHSKNTDSSRRHSRRRLHLSAMNLPGLRHLRSRQSKSSLSSPDSDSLKTPTTANSISSTRANISSPVPILSAGFSNPDDSIPSSIPYSATLPARSSLASISESGTRPRYSRSQHSQEGHQKTPTEEEEQAADTETEQTTTGMKKKGETSGTDVVYHSKQFVTKVPKLEEAPKGGGGFRGHFRRRNKSKDETKMQKEMESLNDEVQEFLNSHKNNSLEKEGAGSNDHHHRDGFKEGATKNGITASTSASSIPLSSHRFDRPQSGARGNHHLTSLDDSQLPHQSPLRTSDDHDNTPTQSQTLNSMNYSLTLPITRRPPRPREDHHHLSKIQKLLNSEDSFNTSLQSNSTGSMYSQDEQDEEGKKREDASMLIGEVLETVKSLGEEVVKGRKL